MNISGDASLTSPWFSPVWTMHQGGRMVATINRTARTYVSVVDLTDGGRILIEPAGVGVVRAVEIHDAGTADTEIGRIVRTSWLGRSWDVSGRSFAFELVSDARPRRWHLAVANAPIAHLEGSLASYNVVHLRSNLGVPLPALLLSWHVVARPWEAANEPRGLVPVRSDAPR